MDEQTDAIEEVIDFLAGYEFINNHDNTEITICIKGLKPFTGVTLEATLKAFLEAYSDSFDDLLDTDRSLQ